MSGLVGSGNIRTDARRAIIDRTPLEQIPNLLEHGNQIRREEIAQPFLRARTTEISKLVDFYELLKKVLETATEEDGTNYPIRFTLEYPPTEVVLPCFTTRLVSRRPLKLGSVREMAPRFMQEYPDPDYPGEVIQEFLVRQYNVIEVTTWAKTAKVTNDLSEWFESKYWEYLWALQWGGSSHPVEWLSRDSDKYQIVREQQMYGAPQTLGVITGRITKKRVTSIRKLSVSLGLLIEDRPDSLTP